jgi:hypothetical protein
VERDTTKEDCEHGDPFQVLSEAAEQCPLLDTISDRDQRDIAGYSEDENNGDVYFEAVDVVVIERSVKETDEEIVDHCEDPGGSDGVVGANVGHDSNLGGKRHVGHEEGEKEARERAFEDPLVERVEDEFVAAVSISAVVLV